MCSTRVKQPPGAPLCPSSSQHCFCYSLSTPPPSQTPRAHQFSTQQTKSDDVDGFLLNARVLRVLFSFCCCYDAFLYTRALALTLWLSPLLPRSLSLIHARFCWLPIGDALVVRGRGSGSGPDAGCGLTTLGVD